MIYGMQGSKNGSVILLSYSFHIAMAIEKLRDVAERIYALLSDYDVKHACRGDMLKSMKDKNGVDRTLHLMLDPN